MMQRLSASLGTDGEVLKCCAMLVVAVAMMWPQRHNGLLYWSMRGAFTLAVAMCFPRFRSGAAAAVTRGMTTLGLGGGAKPEAANGRAAAAAAAGRAKAATTAAATEATSGIERHHQIDKWSWEDAGDAICVIVQLPSASLDRDAKGAVVPPIADARMMPQDFTLTVSTSRADHVLEVKNLFNAIDPRTSGTSVDRKCTSTHTPQLFQGWRMTDCVCDHAITAATGLVTLRLDKWYDASKWKTLVDEGKHPLASMDLDAEESAANFEEAGGGQTERKSDSDAFPIQLGGVSMKKV